MCFKMRCGHLVSILCLHLSIIGGYAGFDLLLPVPTDDHGDSCPPSGVVGGSECHDPWSKVEADPRCCKVRHRACLHYVMKQFIIRQYHT